MHKYKINKSTGISKIQLSWSWSAKCHKPTISRLPRNSLPTIPHQIGTHETIC